MKGRRGKPVLSLSLLHLLRWRKRKGGVKVAPQWFKEETVCGSLQSSEKLTTLRGGDLHQGLCLCHHRERNNPDAWAGLVWGRGGGPTAGAAEKTSGEIQGQSRAHLLPVLLSVAHFLLVVVKAKTSRLNKGLPHVICTSLFNQRPAVLSRRTPWALCPRLLLSQVLLLCTSLCGHCSLPFPFSLCELAAKASCLPTQAPSSETPLSACLLPLPPSPFSALPFCLSPSFLLLLSCSTLPVPRLSFQDTLMETFWFLCFWLLELGS